MKRATLIAAIQRLLRPLVRMMIRNGISSEAFEEMVRKEFVDTAEQDFALPNRKQSDSRISVLTGLPRKKVAKYRTLDLVLTTDQVSKHNRAERVITAWLREPAFLDEKGDPRPLPLEGAGSFAALVDRFAGDVPFRAVADELLRIGNVSRLDNGALRLTVRGYRPKPLSEEAVVVFGRHAADFLSTQDNNLNASDSDQLLLQRQVTYTHIPRSDVAGFKDLSARLGQRLLEDLDRWLAARKEQARLSNIDEQDTTRVGFGVYQVIAPNEVDGDTES